MFQYVWPLGLVVLSNVVYQICAKSVPSGMDPFASLTLTYTTGAIASYILYLLFNKNVNIVPEYGKANWSCFALGLAIVGLEVGFIFAYKAGWPVSLAPTVQAAFLAIALIFVGYILYQEQITWNKIVGIVVCMAGIGLINLK